MIEGKSDEKTIGGLHARITELERHAGLLRNSRAAVCGTLHSIGATLDGRPASEDEPEIVCRVAGVVAELAAARKRVAELEAAPGGVAVAGLLGALSAAAEEIDRVRAIGDRAERETDAFFDGEKHGLLEARKMAREHLAAPTPEQRAAAEVLALGQRYQPDSETSAADYLDHIETLASGGLPLDEPWEEVRTDRDRCLWAAAMALCGVVACDAKPGGGT